MWRFAARFPDGSGYLGDEDEPGSHFNDYPLIPAATGDHPIMQLVYTSRATSRFTDDALLNLLKRARRYNAANGVTGVLMVHDDLFAQCLEGPEGAVRELFGRIERDGRHQSVAVLLEQLSGARTFSEWSMGCTRLTYSETLQLSTARWETLEQRHLEAGTYAPGFILMQTLWEEHRQTAAV